MFLQGPQALARQFQGMEFRHNLPRRGPGAAGKSGQMGGDRMTYADAKEKFGERILGIACTDIVLEGINRNLRNSGGEYSNPLGAEVLRCIEELNRSEWNDLRNIIKRSL